MFLIKHFVTATIHLGQKTNKWNPQTSYFLLGKRDGFFIIDLEQTLIALRRALAFIKKICLKRGYIFFIPAFSESVRAALVINKTHIGNGAGAVASSLPLPLPPLEGVGMAGAVSAKKKNLNYSNFPQMDLNLVFLSSDSFISSAQKQRGMLYAFTQKRKNLPLLSLYSKASNNSSHFMSSGLPPAFADLPFFCANEKLVNLSFRSSQPFLKPEVLFVLQTDMHTALIKEAVKLQIPVVGIISNNTDPYAITYPIPGNSESNEAFLFYTELLINTIIDAKKKEAKIFLRDLDVTGTKKF